jgi:hypothetical protein
MTDTEQDTDDELARRLDYALVAINILGAFVWVAVLVVSIDEMTGGSLRRRLEVQRERWKQAAARRREYDLQVRRVQYEAWAALQEVEQ